MAEDSRRRWSEVSEDGEPGDDGRVESVEVDTDGAAEGEWGGGGMLYIKLRIFIRSAYVSC